VKHADGCALGYPVLSIIWKWPRCSYRLYSNMCR